MFHCMQTPTPCNPRKLSTPSGRICRHSMSDGSPRCAVEDSSMQLDASQGIASFVHCHLAGNKQLSMILRDVTVASCQTYPIRCVWVCALACVCATCACECACCCVPPPPFHLPSPSPLLFSSGQVQGPAGPHRGGHQEGVCLLATKRPQRARAVPLQRTRRAQAHVEWGAMGLQQGDDHAHGTVVI